MNFRVSFESKNGHWMVVAGEPAWRRADLVEHEWAMIRGRQVPGLLRMELEDTDGVLRFRYALTGCRMLAHALRAAPWTMRDAMTALFRLAGVLSDSRLYLLEPHRFLLGEEWIFVGRNGSDLWMAYLPVEDPRPAGRFLPELERLIVSLFVRVEDLDGTVFRQLMLMLREPDFAPQRLRDAVRRWLHDAETGSGAPMSGYGPEDANDAPAAGYGSRDADDRPAAGYGALAASVMATGMTTGMAVAAASASVGSSAFPEYWESPVPDRNPTDWRQRGLPGIGARDKAEPAPEAVRDSPLGPADDRHGDEGNQGLLSAAMTGLIPTDAAEKARKSPVAVICGFVLIAALLWRFLPEWLPGSTGLILSGGLTLILTAGLMWLWLGKKRGKEAGMSPAGTGERVDRKGLQADIGTPVLRNGNPYAADRTSGFGGYADGDWARTGGLDPEEEATVQLQDDADFGRQKPRSPALEWSGGDGGPPQTIALRVSPFVIGRSADAAHHVDRSPGVSRLHVEVAETADGWIAKDLGSRNGTFLNGQPMTPYASYPLKDGDVLQIAASVYRFTC